MMFHRRRTCSAHCLQLLSARILVFLVHAAAVQKSLVSEAPLRILIAALDATHDPVITFSIFSHSHSSSL